MKKSVISLVTAVALVMTAGLTACGGDEHVHDWTESGSTATCGEAGETLFACECGETKTEPAPATGKHNFENGVCKDCGYIDFGNMTVAEGISKYGFFAEDKDGSKTYSAGDSVFFGSYPQSRVEDNEALAALEGVQGALPAAGSAGDWTDYGYYSSGGRSDYAFYKDVTVGENRYRGVYLTDYRPYYSGLAAGEEHSYIKSEGYALETVYWFAFEPVEWKVLGYKDGTLLLASANVLEAQPFQDTYEVSGAAYLIPDSEAYVNDWEQSSLRAFLNGTFYNDAFGENEQRFIQTTRLDNVTTGYSADAPYQKNQKNTDDRVFLLSYQDVNNTDYGYTSRSATRTRSFTDYSVIQGLRTSSESVTADGDPACTYILRSAGDKSYGVCRVSKNGSVSSATGDYSDESVDGLAINGDLGVLPATRIRVGRTAQGIWNDFTFAYDDNGKEAEAECSVYVPASYTRGDRLPLITYIADASYENANLAKYKNAECPSAWITEEKMAENPVFFLIICGSPSDELVVSVIDKVAADYFADKDRLYLTGQSMGGITDFSINDAYPDKFAATVYVDCQPSGTTGDDKYNEVLANKQFLNQKFVYIASRKDLPAAQGQDDVEQVFIDNNKEYGKLYGLDHNGGDALEAAVKAELDKGYDCNFLGFTQVANGNTGSEHMNSFKYGYAIDAIFNWLLAQHK